MTKYYDHTDFPQQGSRGVSESMRAEFQKIENGFDQVSNDIDEALTGAAGAVTIAQASATAAQSYASQAESSKNSANASAVAADISEANSAASASSALASKNAVDQTYDDFDDRYLGRKSSNPIVDNDGDPLQEGSLYFNTTSKIFRGYNGSSWINLPATTADNIQVTPGGNISSLNVEDAIYELDSEKSGLSGNNSYTGLNEYDQVVTFKGGINLSGLGLKIVADFSAATPSDRAAFQTSITNGSTRLLAIPNGSGTVSSFSVLNSSDANNASWLQISITSSSAVISSTFSGSGVLLPLVFQTGGADRFRIDTLGNATVISSTGGIGYGTGSGGSVTQTVSKSTAVTLNRPVGQITMHNASLAAGASVSFTLSNSLLGLYDSFSIGVGGGSVDPDNYRVFWRMGGGGAVRIIVVNSGALALAESLLLNFAVIKGVIA